MEANVWIENAVIVRLTANPDEFVLRTNGQRTFPPQKVILGPRSNRVRLGRHANYQPGKHFIETNSTHFFYFYFILMFFLYIFTLGEEVWWNINIFAPRDYMDNDEPLLIREIGEHTVNRRHMARSEPNDDYTDDTDD